MRIHGRSWAWTWVGVVLASAPDAAAQDAATQQQYETGRALAITGTVIQPFLGLTASGLVAAGAGTFDRDGDEPRDDDATGDPAPAAETAVAASETPADKPYDPDRALIIGGMVLRATSAFGTPVLQHIGALQMDQAITALGGRGQPELSYVGLALQGVSGALALASDGLSLTRKPGGPTVWLGATSGALSFSAWIISIVHIENDRVDYDARSAVTFHQADMRRVRTPWSGPELLVHAWTLPSGHRLGLLVGSGVGIVGTL